jgi:hypothetical protein
MKPWLVVQVPTAVAIGQRIQAKASGTMFFRKIHMPGGILQVRLISMGIISATSGCVGPAIFVFEGRINPMTLMKKEEQTQAQPLRD